MKLFNTFAGICFVLCLIGLQTACKKEADTFDIYPITITSVDTLGTTKLNWTKIESADFIEYVVVRSNKDSITDFNELNTNGGATIVGRISNAKQNEFFEFTGNTVVSRVYYRVFARLKNRTISSRNYVLNSDLVLLNFPVPNEVIQDELNPNLVYFNSSNSGQIALYDLSKDSIIARSSTVFSSNRIALASDRGNNAEIVQVLSSSRKIVFRDAQTLDIKFTMDFTSSIYSVDGSQDGFVCVTTDDYSKLVQLIRLSDHKVVSTQSYNIENNYFYSGSFVTKIPNANTILLSESSSSNPNIAKLTYDAQGVFTQAKLLGRITSASTSFQFNKISSKGNYYFMSGQIYAEPLDISKPLNTFIQSGYSDFYFKQDESKFYLIRQNFSSSVTNTLEEYSLPNGKQLRTLGVKVVGRFVIYKDKAYIFGVNNNGSSQQTIVQKIQL